MHQQEAFISLGNRVSSHLQSIQLKCEHVTFIVKENGAVYQNILVCTVLTKRAKVHEPHLYKYVIGLRARHQNGRPITKVDATLTILCDTKRGFQALISIGILVSVVDNS